MISLGNPRQTQLFLDLARLLATPSVKGIPARLATLLLRLAAAGASQELTDYTHQDLADLVGAYRETATQTLDDFKRRGLLELGRKRIQILDPDGLARIAGT